MNRRILTVFLIAVFVFLTLNGCAAKEEYSTENVSSTTNQDSITDVTEQIETTVNTSKDEPEETTSGDFVTESETEPTTDDSESDDELLDLSDGPSYGFIWALDEEAIRNVEKDVETIEYITYDGGPVTVFCQLTNASLNPWEYGLFIEVEGVLQEITVDGLKTEMYCIELQSRETRTVKMTFEPNMGKKDEILNLSCAIVLSPKHIAEEDGEYNLYHELASSGNFPLVMNADAPDTADVTDNTSLYTVSEIDRTIYSNYEESDNLEYFESSPCCFVYEKLRDYLKRDGGTYIRSTRITTKASENSRLTVNIHGKPGTYRVSLYLNGKRLDVFDGKGYIDVTIGKHQQAEIPITIDTRELKGANRIEAYYKQTDCNFVDGEAIASSGPQKYIVK